MHDGVAKSDPVIIGVGVVIPGLDNESGTRVRKKVGSRRLRTRYQSPLSELSESRWHNLVLTTLIADHPLPTGHWASGHRIGLIS